MKKVQIAILLLLGTNCFGQKQYYRFTDNPLMKERSLKYQFESIQANLPSTKILIPIIYHRIEKKDSIINYVLFKAREKTSENEQSKFEFVFEQDSLYLFLNKKLPEFNLKDLNGKTFCSAELLGKPSLIIFWSIRCAPCILEMPQLDRLKTKYGDKVNFVAIGINTFEEVQRFINQNPFSFYILSDGNQYRKYSLKSKEIMRDIFLDKNGYIVDIQEGLPFMIDPETMTLRSESTNLFESIIKKLIKN
jgi:cytochrome c biogenesis protein CcmG, thiol:disulfide interchange protein DsbE